MTNGYELLVEPTPTECAETAAGLIIEALAGSSTPVLGVATGLTPLPTYAELTARSFDVSHLQLVLLDEYIGLPADSEASFRAAVRRLLAEPLGLPPERVHAPPHEGAPTPETCAQFEAHLGALGGIDLQLLGIGRNGHIGFNEPGSALDSRTRVVELTAETIEDNAAPFAAARFVPRRACTQGIATILGARQLLLLATGRHKAEILRTALLGPVTPDVPASAIRLHPRAVVIADRAAAHLLRTGDDDVRARGR